jgi:hypothetical protein
MTDSNAFETAQLSHIFNNADFANIGDATGLRGSSTAGSLYAALYKTDPGEAGTAITNEADYTSYARVAIARSAGGFTVSGNQVSNTAQINWPASTGVADDQTVGYWGIVSSASGAGTLLCSGQLGTALRVTNLVQPYIAAGGATYTKD